ncbi:hypothetical protein MLD38_017738 [Melastoma candidum]|uniref:Uncharacterized protein n=1 Tax=Melastoma candidum TaxID=119954 RepID=A0ACB9QSR5_9MYRT|nr:hypothetical protein MLD38_017738 [Melastoma candidum]
MASVSRKRPPPAKSPAFPSKHPTPPPPSAPHGDDFLDEDVYLEETLIEAEEDEESLILRDLEEQQPGDDASRLSKWARPPVTEGYASRKENILFQQLEIDYIVGESHKELMPDRSGPATVIRIFGFTREGHSVCCNVHGFEPYFYISCPPGMGPDDISRFHQTLEACIY